MKEEPKLKAKVEIGSICLYCPFCSAMLPSPIGHTWDQDIYEDFLNCGEATVFCKCGHEVELPAVDEAFPGNGPCPATPEQRLRDAETNSFMAMRSADLEAFVVIIRQQRREAASKAN